jgi:hypothetical protein
MSTAIESVSMKLTETEDGVEACFEGGKVRFCCRFTIEAEPEEKAKLKLVFASTIVNMMKMFVDVMQLAIRVMNECLQNPECMKLLKPQ